MDIPTLIDLAVSIPSRIIPLFLVFAAPLCAVLATFVMTFIPNTSAVAQQALPLLLRARISFMPGRIFRTIAFVVCSLPIVVMLVSPKTARTALAVLQVITE